MLPEGSTLPPGAPPASGGSAGVGSGRGVLAWLRAGIELRAEDEEPAAGILAVRPPSRSLSARSEQAVAVSSAPALGVRSGVREGMLESEGSAGCTGTWHAHSPTQGCRRALGGASWSAPSQVNDRPPPTGLSYMQRGQAERVAGDGRDGRPARVPARPGRLQAPSAREPVSPGAGVPWLHYPNLNHVGDTLAAIRVFESGIPVDVVGHAVTSQLWWAPPTRPRAAPAAPFGRRRRERRRWWASCSSLAALSHGHLRSPGRRDLPPRPARGHRSLLSRPLPRAERARPPDRPRVGSVRHVRMRRGRPARLATSVRARASRLPQRTPRPGPP
jgi:hypothetical protein